MLSCGPVGLPPGAKRIVPPSEYRRWWQQIEDCSGRSGRFDDVRFYEVPDPFWHDGVALAGLTYMPTKQIVLNRRFRADSSIVGHEELHVLLGVGYKHPPEYYRRRCKDLVACAGECLKE